MPVPGERLDGLDAASFEGVGEAQAGQHGLVIDQHRTGAAFAAVTAGLGSGEADHLAQVIEQQDVVGDRVLAFPSVQREGQDLAHGGRATMYL